ncbi:MAG: hypothetical protein AB7F19_00600 [Candidatus Babeliales bacterium]
MNHYALIMLLLPTAGWCMVKQDPPTRAKKEALFNLKQVLTAGKYVYGHHVAIHSDAKRRSKEILTLWELEGSRKVGGAPRAAIAQKMAEWQALLESVKELYKQEVSPVDEDTRCQLEQSCASCATWVALLQSNQEIDPLRWNVFAAHLTHKKDFAEKNKQDAVHTQERFERNEQKDERLPLTPAVIAWYIYLPPLTKD